jgi:hypothetical protein
MAVQRINLVIDVLALVATTEIAKETWSVL